MIKLLKEVMRLIKSMNDLTLSYIEELREWSEIMRKSILINNKKEYEMKHVMKRDKIYKISNSTSDKVKSPSNDKVMIIYDGIHEYCDCDDD